MDKCGGKYTNIKDFCKIVKALILFGYCSEVIWKKNHLCNIFNHYNTCIHLSGNLALLGVIGDQTDFANIVKDFTHHQSVTYVKNYLSGEFVNFIKVTTSVIFKVLKSREGNKATGCDKILPNY